MNDTRLFIIALACVFTAIAAVPAARCRRRRHSPALRVFFKVAAGSTVAVLCASGTAAALLANPRLLVIALACACCVLAAVPAAACRLRGRSHALHVFYRVAAGAAVAILFACGAVPALP